MVDIFVKVIRARFGFEKKILVQVFRITLPHIFSNKQVKICSKSTQVISAFEYLAQLPSISFQFFLNKVGTKSCVLTSPFPDGKEKKLQSPNQINLSFSIFNFYLAIYNDRSQALVKIVSLITKDAKTNRSTTTVLFFHIVFAMIFHKIFPKQVLHSEK